MGNVLLAVKSVRVRITPVKSVEASSRAITRRERWVLLPEGDLPEDLQCLRWLALSQLKLDPSGSGALSTCTLQSLASCILWKDSARGKSYVRRSSRGLRPFSGSSCQK